MMAAWMASSAHKARAERFALGVPARVRPEGHATWRDADVVNVSRSGVLLAVSPAFPPAATIDLVFGMTDGASGVADVQCVAHIVREGRDAQGRPLLAAAFDQYVFSAPPSSS
jgi:hypothetical protein